MLNVIWVLDFTYYMIFEELLYKIIANRPPPHPEKKCMRIHNVQVEHMFLYKLHVFWLRGLNLRVQVFQAGLLSNSTKRIGAHKALEISHLDQ